MDRILYQIFKIILSIFKKKHGEDIDKLSVQIYVNKIENRISFKIKNGYSLGLLTPKTMNQQDSRVLCIRLFQINCLIPY